MSEEAAIVHAEKIAVFRRMLPALRPGAVFLGCLYTAFLVAGVGLIMFGGGGHSRFGVVLILNAAIPCVALAVAELVRRLGASL